MAWRGIPYSDNGGKDGKGSKCGKKGKWQGSCKGRGGKKCRKTNRPGEFSWSFAVPLSGDPNIQSRATYSYVAKSPSTIDVVSPAWTVRRLRELPEGGSIDLSLERGLLALQTDSGGFGLTTQLAFVLGLENPEGMLALADDVDADAFGALLAVKVVRVCKGMERSRALQSLCESAERLVCQSFNLVDVASLHAALDFMGSTQTLETWECGTLNEDMRAVVKSNFVPAARWSFFELWAQLLPQSTLHTLKKEGGVLCPRFFLVDLASAALSPYEMEKDYPLVRHGACLFVGQPADTQNGGGDAMRQGRQLEAELLSYGWLEEDHVLTEVILPQAGGRGSVRAIFSAAPDAVENDGVEVEPLVAGDDESYVAAGYRLDKTFPGVPGKHEKCRLWCGSHQPVSAKSYVEVKKTTHLNGRPGQFKMLKFWLQAALMGCGTVVVALTEGSADGNTVESIKRFSLADLAAGIDAPRVWAMLAGMLQHVLDKTADSDGAWTLRAEKAYGHRFPVQLSVWRGWHGQEVHGSQAASASIVERLNAFFERAVN
eukprot:TRINITY_DN77594_c0_g1_i1.p1 TRINITY_DN77594_c0_g1~~TRINITY_DN77594_c0_g1_i1.p1  ORF type:complete len:544 (-),score=84.01 TRINITY_DN77594_c0_g1_i1:239-1870(-)